jgi:lysophospholipase L1-like esterase
MKKAVVILVALGLVIPTLVIGLILLMAASLLNSANQAASNDPCIAYQYMPDAGYGGIDPSLLPETITLSGRQAENLAGIVAQSQSMSKGGNNSAAIAAMTAYAESRIGQTPLNTIASSVDSPQGMFQQTTAWFSDFPREVFATEADPRNSPFESSKRFNWSLYSIVSGEARSQFESPAAIKQALSVLGVSTNGTPEQRWRQFQKADLSLVFKPGNVAGLNAFLVLTNAVQGHLTKGGILSGQNYNHPSATNFKNAFNEMSPQVAGLYGSNVIPISGASSISTSGEVTPLGVDASQESFVGDSFFTNGGVLSGADFPESAYVNARNGESLGNWALSSGNKPARDRLAAKTGSVTVSFGYNDTSEGRTSFADKIDAFMKVVGSERPVYWYTLHSLKPGTPYYTDSINATYAQHNKDLRDAAIRYPNLTLIDAGSVIDRKPLQYIGLDGLHLTSSGYALLWEMRQGVSNVSFVAGPNTTNIPAECLGSLGDFGTQQLVGTDGLPLNAPPESLKDGLTQEEFVNLGQTAVSNAPTPQAALAIKWALTNLGIPYACWATPNGQYSPPKTYSGNTYKSQYVARTGPDAYDCSSFVNSAYRKGAGMTDVNLVGTLSMGRAGGGRMPVYKPVDRRQMQPGDLIVYNSGGGAAGGHVMMFLGQSVPFTDENGKLNQSDDEWVTDTGSCGDVSRVKKLNRSDLSRIDRNWNVVRPTPTNSKSIDSIAAMAAGTQAG